ncbi:hypothetical protein N4G69_18835 [Streptomyces mirabilis]|uniref:hypothetical protein n=1 Tax=Streptomyces mirabilis TaxID=68239 RepID=UPI0021C14F89|nr:hypothetical protein [Streptomyces mirabilis]MCT9107667.1 hypothetical protein [Streptomyces mirabilis]
MLLCVHWLHHCVSDENSALRVTGIVRFVAPTRRSICPFLTGVELPRTHARAYRRCCSRLADRSEKGQQTVFFQLLDGAPVGAIIPVGAVCVVLALARVVKNLPRDTISKFFEHRTTRYQIIAGDAKGRVAAMQKQRFVFLSFVFTCIVVVALVFISSTRNGVESPVHNPAPAATKTSQPAP